MAQMVKNLPAMQETQVQSLSQEEGNGSHSSILAWRIPQTEERGGLRSMKSQRVGQDRVCMHMHAHIPINESQKNDKNV